MAAYRSVGHLWLVLMFATLPALSPAHGGSALIYVTNSAGDNIHVIDPATNKVVQEIKGVEAAHGIVAAPDGSRVYVSNEADTTLDVFDRASGEQIFPEGGGLQIRDSVGDVIGAVGVTGDTEERDEELAAYGIRAVGLKTDEDCAAMGRRGGVRLTNK